MATAAERRRGGGRPRGAGADLNDTRDTNYTTGTRNSQMNSTGQTNKTTRTKRSRVDRGDAHSMVEMRRRPDHEELRSSVTAPTMAKTCVFYQDERDKEVPIKLVITPKHYRKLDIIMKDLSRRMKGLPFGVRTIYTPRATHRIRSVEQFTSEAAYVCSSKPRCKPLDINHIAPPPVWHSVRPDSGRRALNKLLHDQDSYSAKRRRLGRPDYDMTNVYNRVSPKKVKMMRNGDPHQCHTMLFNRKTAQNFEQVLETLSEMFGFAVMKLYTIDGHEVKSLSSLFSGPDALVVAGAAEPFKPRGLAPSDQLATSRNRSRMSTHDSIASRMVSRRERLAKTRGKWKVLVTTNALPSAGTSAQVVLVAYGTKGNSGPLTLGMGDGRNFQPGSIDEFDVSVGNIGEIYKIRLSHDNSGDSPGWRCDEVRMKDVDTNEDLIFHCKHWMARDEEDHEICRELPAVRKGEAVLPVLKYEVEVTTGDIWGGGTDANVYMTIYGDRGDTGVRQLYTELSDVYFKQGQCDTFEIEAVSLGKLKRIIIGHDGTGPGKGWFLDRVVIREPRSRPHEEYVFNCFKWLDEGEDDGKIVRELKVQDEYMDDILERKNWEFMKWMFGKTGLIKLYSTVTNKALRIKSDGSVDALGREKEPDIVFQVIPKKSMRVMLHSVEMEGAFLSIDNGRLSGQGRGGPYCEFRVRVQSERSVLLEAVKSPLQFITINADGHPGDVRGVIDRDPTRRFVIYSKGVFRHRGVIMFGTSSIQAVNIDLRDGVLRATGRPAGPMAQFRVHKVADGVRMFESMASPGRYIRIKDGKIDCMGERDQESQFLVTKHKDKGYITLQSASQRGLFLGMTPDGRVHTTIDTGVRNIWLYPEVVEFGIPKSQSKAIIEQEMLEGGDLDYQDTPKAGYAEGDWSIHVVTEVQLENADVALVAYGDMGNSGPIMLGAPPGKVIFQDGNEDEFRANLLKVGQIFKVRLELYPKSMTKTPSWKVREVKMQDLNTKETLQFTFNRWLSPLEEDMDIMRELPVSRPGERGLNVMMYEVHVHTGKDIGAETDANVYLNVYGENGDWGKRRLIQSNHAKKFRIGQEDIFYVEAVSLGELQRCVIGHDGTGAGEGWFLDKVVVKESEHAQEECVFPCDRWLDTSLEDRKIERTLTVKARPVSILVPDTPLEVIEEEEALPPVLHPSSPSEKREEEDVQEEEKPSEDITEQKQDELLLVEEKDEVKEEEKAKSAGEYKLWVKTNEDSSPHHGGRVTITLYGETGKSEEIKLYAPNPTTKTFEPGNIDEFEVSAGDIGEIYKVRLGREDIDKWEAWHLGEVKLQDKSTHSELVFYFDRWMGRDKEDKDLVRELPAVRSGQPVLPVTTYQVQVYTGDHWAAETDANIYITIYGTRGDCGKRKLYNCTNNMIKFQRGQVDIFEFEAVSLEELTAIDISHDGRGHGAGIFLDKIIVKEKEGDKSHLQYVFPYGRWLDDHEDDCSTEATLRCVDVTDNRKPPPSKEAGRKSKGLFTAKVKTSDLTYADTTARVYVTVYGTSGHSNKIQLGGQGDNSDKFFAQGKESEQQIDIGEVGKLTKIRLEHDNSGTNPDWHLDYVKLIDNDTTEEYVFYVDRWFALDQEDGHIIREYPVIKKGAVPLPVFGYVIRVTTGSMRDAGIENGDISINLIGVNGDTGFRPLLAPITKRSPCVPGQEDVYTVDAVSVGKLKTIELKLQASGPSRWFVEQVCIAEGIRALSESVFYCNKWLDTSREGAEMFDASEVIPATHLSYTLDAIPRGLERSMVSKGKWNVWIQTGLQTDAGTMEDVYMVMCGLKNQSEPVLLNEKGALNPGAVSKFEVKVGDLGLLFKLRFYFGNKHQGASWLLQKVKLKDQDTGEELRCDFGDWLESTEENPEGAVEIPIVRPDMAPLKEQIYIVSVKTGDSVRADTDAEIFCNLLGQWGTSGLRSLASSNNPEKFKRGQIDEFCITSLDLGSIQKILVSHDTHGRGQGWYCESVIVKLAEHTEKVFPCNRWLDTGCDDRKLMRLLLPIGEVPLDAVPPSKYITPSDGTWNFHITTAGRDHLPSLGQSGSGKREEVSITVYGHNGVRGPIELAIDDIEAFLPGKTDIFYEHDLEDIGEIEKIRVSAGYEEDLEHVWSIKEVVLEDTKTKEKLKFDFSQWVGEVGGDIRKELPLVVPGKSSSPVDKYYIEAHTSDAEMNAGTNSNVFITLYGSKSDSGRRHLIRSLDTDRRFQTGQGNAGQVDRFTLDAVELGDLEKIVIGKGPGKPWLLEKVVVKLGEFGPVEHVFMHDKWLGTKDAQSKEVEVQLPLSATIPSSVAIPFEQVEHLKTSRGSWRVETITGGRKGGDGVLDAVVVFCGDRGESKPLPLTTSRENAFEIGQTDTFDVQLEEDVGELLKIRLGFKDNSIHKGWYVRQITFEDMDTRDTFTDMTNDWVVVDNKVDGWKEFAIVWPAIHVLPVYKYLVSVHVGEVHKDGSDADVYVTMVGNYGGTGMRLLKESSTNTEKIKSNQVDVFEVEAVSLGDIEKVVIGHNSKGAGNGWFLNRVVVQESADAKEQTFECNKWLDEGEDDGQIERTIYAIYTTEPSANKNTHAVIGPPLVSRMSTPEHHKDQLPEHETEEAEHVGEITLPDDQTVEELQKLVSPEPEHETQGHKWLVTTVTGDDVGEGTRSSVEIILYGNKGRSDPLVLGYTEEFRFSKGQEDTFEVFSANDIGELFKIRVGFHNAPEDQLPWYQDYSGAPSWFIESMKLVDDGRGKEYEMMAQTWVKFGEYEDFWRELPVKDGAQKLEVFQYQVHVYTGDEFKGGTDANVFLQIFGECGDTGMRRLMASKTNTNKFEQGAKDVFELNAVDLGKLTKVKISHDGAGAGSGWFLQKIIIKETENSQTRYVFNCERWLDAGGDIAIEEVLDLSEILVGEDLDDAENVYGTPWKLETVTGGDAGEGTDHAMELVLYGDKGVSQPVLFGEDDSFRFNMGQEDTFDLRVLEDVGDLYKVRVGFHGVDHDISIFESATTAPSWFVERLNLKDERSQKEYDCLAGIWVRLEAYHDYWRELPVNRGDLTLPVHGYHVEIYTGEAYKGGTDANVSVQIFGERGDTGRRRLMGSKTNSNKFEQGSKDVFEIPAVDLGMLTKIKVSHDGAGIGSGWFLEKVVVKESEDSTIQYIFQCGKWLDIQDGSPSVEEEIPLTEMKDVTGEAEMQGVTGEKSPTPVPPKEGDWIVLVTTSGEEESGTSASVTLIVYGDRDNSGPLPLGEPGSGHFNTGSTDAFDVFIDPEDIGQLRKIRLEHNQPSGSWKVDKVVMKNKQNNTEIEFPINKALSFGERHGDISVEVAARNGSVDFPELSVRNYIVQTETGEGFGSGTDALVFINLIGNLGDTGRRYLMHNMEEVDKFESGQTDTFIIEAVDLGRLQQVVVGHDGAGVGSGWLLNRVLVKESLDSKDTFIFTCGQWLHEEKDDKMTVRELMLDRVETEEDEGEQQVEQEDQQEDGGGQEVIEGDKADEDEDVKERSESELKVDEVENLKQDEEDEDVPKVSEDDQKPKEDEDDKPEDADAEDVKKDDDDVKDDVTKTDDDGDVAKGDDRKVEEEDREKE